MLRKNKRKFFRLKAYQLAKYRVISPKEGEHIVFNAVKDIGGEGVCFRTKEDLPISSILELQINVPFLDKPLDTVAKVVWTKIMGRTNKYEIGVQFLDIEKDYQRKIIKRIDFVREKISGGDSFFRRLFKKGGKRR